MLGSLRERLAEIERTNDVQTKQQVIQLLVVLFRRRSSRHPSSSSALYQP